MQTVWHCFSIEEFSSLIYSVWLSSLRTFMPCWGGKLWSELWEDDAFDTVYKVYSLKNVDSSFPGEYHGDVSQLCTCLAFLRTDVFLSASLTLGGFCLYAPFVYLFSSLSLLRQVLPSMSVRRGRFFAKYCVCFTLLRYCIFKLEEQTLLCCLYRNWFYQDKQVLCETFV